MNDVTIFRKDEFGAVRAVTLEGEPWFVAADVCRALGLGNSSMAISKLDEDERTLILIEGASNGLPAAERTHKAEMARRAAARAARRGEIICDDGILF